VREGIQRGSPWDELQGQVLLGEEGFVGKFKNLLEDKKQIKEIPRPQRYVSRPSLDKIFSGQKARAQRDISINAAHMSHGYTLKEIADYLRIHYTTVSKVIAKAAVSKKWISRPDPLSVYTWDLFVKIYLAFTVTFFGITAILVQREIKARQDFKILFFGGTLNVFRYYAHLRKNHEALSTRFKLCLLAHFNFLVCVIVFVITAFSQ
jgi:hypothetical protein